MTIFKKAAVLLIAAALLVLPAGCAGNEPSGQGDVSAPSGSESAPEAETTAGAGFEYDAAYAALAPDTVILTAGGYNITWAELYYYICGNIDYINASVQFDWSDEAYEGVTIEDIILDSAVNQALSYKAVMYGAGLLGASLGEEDYAALEEKYAAEIEEAGGEEAYLDMLRTERHIYSREMDKYMSETDMLVGACYKLMFGENGSKMTDEVVAERTAQDNYLMAKHILRKKTEEPTAEGEKPKALLEAEEILKKLNDYDGDDFGAFFDELMHENSEDSGGLASFPDGYLFQDGDMVSSFYEGCRELEIGSYSGIIESDYGYHIIYRLPINYDAMPSAYTSQGVYATLRQIAAADVFNASVTGWMENLEVTFTDAYYSLSLADIFKTA